ncbi:MAG: hypothetical protein ACR2N8_02960 [Parvibaculales bacterium]
MPKAIHKAQNILQAAERIAMRNEKLAKELSEKTEKLEKLQEPLRHIESLLSSPHSTPAPQSRGESLPSFAELIARSHKLQSRSQNTINAQPSQAQLYARLARAVQKGFRNI